MMDQTLDSLPTDCTNQILCCYVNATSRVQVARITNIPDWYFERVVFPGQKLLFVAPVAAQLEIHSNALATAILTDRIDCQTLQVQER